MSLTENQIIDLLKTAAAYDHRKPDAVSVIAYSEAARRGRWRFDTAVEAIHEHYAHCRDRLMPADITAFHRANPVRPCDTPVAELPARSVPASQSVREAAMREIRALAAKWSL